MPVSSLLPAANYNINHYKNSNSNNNSSSSSSSSSSSNHQHSMSITSALVASVQTTEDNSPVEITSSIGQITSAIISNILPLATAQTANDTTLPQQSMPAGRFAALMPTNKTRIALKDDSIINTTTTITTTTSSFTNTNNSNSTSSSTSTNTSTSASITTISLTNGKIPLTSNSNTYYPALQLPLIEDLVASSDEQFDGSDLHDLTFEVFEDVDDTLFGSPLAFDDGQNGLWNGRFVPPPPRPPFLLNEPVLSDGLTTCDLCSWAMPTKTTFIFQGTMEKASELGWPLTLTIVSILSALLGAIIMIVILKCKRKKTTHHRSDTHVQWWSRNKRSNVHNNNNNNNWRRSNIYTAHPADNGRAVQPNPLGVSTSAMAMLPTAPPITAVVPPIEHQNQQQQRQRRRRELMNCDNEHDYEPECHQPCAWDSSRQPAQQQTEMLSQTQLQPQPQSLAHLNATHNISVSSLSIMPSITALPAMSHNGDENRMLPAQVNLPHNDPNSQPQHVPQLQSPQHNNQHEYYNNNNNNNNNNGNNNSNSNQHHQHEHGSNQHLFQQQTHRRHQQHHHQQQQQQQQQQQVNNQHTGDRFHWPTVTTLVTT